jgi:peptidoglycan hydrolase CwlO-like protein
MMMETLLAVSVTVIAAVMMTRAVFEILVLVQVRRAAREAEKLLASVSCEVSSISSEVKSFVQSIHEQAERVEDSIETFHDMAAWMKAFQSEVKPGIEETLLQLAAVLGGVRRGLEAVTSSMYGRKTDFEKSRQRRDCNE